MKRFLINGLIFINLIFVVKIELLIKVIGIFFIIPFVFFNKDRSIIMSRLTQIAKYDSEIIELLYQLDDEEKRDNETEENYQLRLDKLIDYIDLKQENLDKQLLEIPYNSYFFKHNDLAEYFLFSDCFYY